MNSPEEKAKYIVEKFRDHLACDLTTTQAKAFALICVDEIMKYVPDTAWEYWQKVKEEIQKL